MDSAILLDIVGQPGLGEARRLHLARQIADELVEDAGGNVGHALTQARYSAEHYRGKLGRWTGAAREWAIKQVGEYDDIVRALGELT